MYHHWTDHLSLTPKVTGETLLPNLKIHCEFRALTLNGSNEQKLAIKQLQKCQAEANLPLTTTSSPWVETHLRTSYASVQPDLKLLVAYSKVTLPLQLEPCTGPQRWLREHSIFHTRRGCKSWKSSAWRKEDSGRSYQHVNWWEGMKKREPDSAP